MDYRELFNTIYIQELTSNATGKKLSGKVFAKEFSQILSREVKK